MQHCGAFNTSIYHLDVYAKKVSCTLAFRIEREYWLGAKRNKVFVNGGSGALGYILLKRYPGWRCNSGAGGGVCQKGQLTAAYQVTGR